jgi:hypothetical protein
MIEQTSIALLVELAGAFEQDITLWLDSVYSSNFSLYILK